MRRSINPFCTRVIATFLLSFCFQVVTLAGESSPKLGPSSVKVHLDQSLNIQRTRLTLALYAPVLANLIEVGRQEKEGYWAKIRSIVDSRYNPQSLYVEKKECLGKAVNIWAEAIETGEVGLTTTAIQKVFSGTLLSPACRSFLDPILGPASSLYPHGQFFERLKMAELNYVIHERKLEHLRAAQMLLVSSGDDFSSAVEAIAKYYMEDKNKTVAQAAKDFLRHIPGTSRLRQGVNFVKPDYIMVAGPAISGLLASLSQLPFSYKLNALAVSLAAHIGVIKASMTVTDPMPLQVQEASVRAKVHPSATDKKLWLRNMEELIAKSRYDSYTNEDLTLVVQNELYQFFRYGKTQIDLRAFLVNFDHTHDARLNPLRYNSLVIELENLSDAVSIPLIPRQNEDLMSRINRARHELLEIPKFKKFSQQQSLISHYLGNEGGNFFAQTQLAVATFWPNRKNLGPWILGIQVYRDGWAPVLYHPKEKQIIDLISGKWSIEINAPIFHPYVLLNAYLDSNHKELAIDWRKFLIAGELPKKSSTPEESTPDSMSIPSGPNLRFHGSPPNKGHLNLKDLDLTPQNPTNKAPSHRNQTDPIDLINEINRDSIGKLITPSLDTEDGSEDGKDDCAGAKFFTPEMLDAKMRSELNTTILTNVPILYLSRCKGRQDKLVGYKMLVRTEEIRRELENLPSDQIRAEYLQLLLLNEIGNRIHLLQNLKHFLLNPTTQEQLFHLNDSFETRFFNNKDLLEMVQTIVDLQTAKVNPISLSPEYQQEITISALTIPEMGKLVELQLAILKMLTDQPQAILAIVDSPNVLKENLEAIEEVYQSGISVAPLKMDAVEIKVIETAVEKAHEAFDQMISDPRILGISEPLITSTSQKLPEFIDPKGLPQTPRVTFIEPLKPQACTGSEESERCRKQTLVYVNPVPAKKYVSPKAFFTLVDWLTPFRARSNRIGQRWTPELELLMLQTHREILLKLIDNLQKSRTEQSVPFFSLNDLPYALREKFKDQPYKITSRQLIELSDKNEIKNVEITTSKRLSQMFSCQQVRNAKLMPVLDDYRSAATNEHTVALAQREFFKKVIPILQMYSNCLNRIP